MYLIRQLLHQFTQYMPHTLYNNFVHVRSIVMIHKYGTAYPSLQQVNSLALYLYFSSRWQRLYDNSTYSSSFQLYQMPF